MFKRLMLGNTWRGRVMRGLLAMVLATGLTTAVIESPAFAAGSGGCNDSHPSVTACVNFYDPNDMNRIRADYYQKINRDSGSYWYSVAIYRSNQPTIVDSGILGNIGWHGYFYLDSDNLPDTCSYIWVTVTVATVEGYTHFISESPHFWYCR